MPIGTMRWAAARRAAPRLTALTGGFLVSALGHGFVQIAGGLLLLVVGLPGWRGWYRSVATGSKDMTVVPAEEL